MPFTCSDNVQDDFGGSINGLPQTPDPVMVCAIPFIDRMLSVCTLLDEFVTVYCMVAVLLDATNSVVAVKGVRVHNGVPE